MKSANNRTRFAQALTELLEHKNLETISVSDIARQSGRTRQSFYHYFRDRDDLLMWMYQEEFADMFAAHDSFSWDELVLYMLRELQKKRAVYREMLRTASDQTLFRIMRAYTHTLYGRMIAYRTGKEMDERTSILLQMYSGGGIELAARWIREGMRIPIEELRELFLLGMPELLREKLVGYTAPAAVLRGKSAGTNRRDGEGAEHRP